MAADCKNIDYESEIEVPIMKAPYNGKVIKTTPGRIIFNEEMPDEIEFVNELLGNNELKKLIEKVYKTQGSWITVKMLDAIKAVGYKYATFFGATISMGDILIPDSKSEMMEAANKEVEQIMNQYHKGVITGDERYNKVVEVWSRTNEELTNAVMKTLESDQEGFNTIYMMAASGARGSKNQIRQLGSDEVLAVAFQAFFSGRKHVLMPDISYSFYPVYCNLYDVEAKEEIIRLFKFRRTRFNNKR